MRLFKNGIDYRGTVPEQLAGVIFDLCGVLEKISRRWDLVMSEAADPDDIDDMVWKYARCYELACLDRPKKYRAALRLIYDGSMDSREYSYALAFSSNVRELYRYVGMLSEAYGKPEERIDIRKEHIRLTQQLEVLRERLCYIDDTDLEGFREFLSDTETAVQAYRKKLARLLCLFRRLRSTFLQEEAAGIAG
ncbi:MAG: hypothetical protein IJT43_01580 [Stomatobaculum sp.]|nr:hypothetical protein [Stomatobaculum sp.]